MPRSSCGPAWSCYRKTVAQGTLPVSLRGQGQLLWWPSLPSANFRGVNLCSCGWQSLDPLWNLWVEMGTRVHSAGTILSASPNPLLLSPQVACPYVGCGESFADHSTTHAQVSVVAGSSQKAQIQIPASCLQLRLPALGLSGFSTEWE